MNGKILLSIFIIGGTLVELYLLWYPKFFQADYLKLLAGGIVALDVLALLQILLNI